MAAQEGNVRQTRVPRISATRIVSVGSWLVGAAITWLGLAVFMSTAPWWLPVLIAGGAQLFLTLAQRAIWRGHPSFVSFVALAIDVALNAGGIFPYAQQIGQTPTAQMIITVAGANAKTAQQITPITAMIVAIALGLLIAAAPEELWNRKD